jgi:hypothetical protein
MSLRVNMHCSFKLTILVLLVSVLPTSGQHINAANSISADREYIVLSSGEFLQIDTATPSLVAKWNLAWIQGGEQLFKGMTYPDVLQLKLTSTDLYAIIASAGRDNPNSTWYLVRFSLPSFAVTATTELSNVRGLPVLLRISPASAVIGWFNASDTTTDLVFMNPLTFRVLNTRTLPKTVISNRAFLVDGSKSIVDHMRMIDIDTGTSTVFGTFAGLSPEEKSALDSGFSTPDPATQKPFVSFGVIDSNSNALLLSADDSSGKKAVFWIFKLGTNTTSGFRITTPADARITPSGDLMVLQHLTEPGDDVSSGFIEIVDTKSGDSHTVHFPVLEGPLSANHLICTSNTSATFSTQTGIYVLLLPQAESLVKINTFAETDKEQACNVTLK